MKARPNTAAAALPALATRLLDGVRRLVERPRLVAVARVGEAAVRRSRRLRRLGRRAAAALARLSPEAKAFVQLRLMRLV